MQEKLLHRGILSREHLVGEVVQHIAMAAAEGREKRGDIGSAPKRKRSQLQPGNPAFRAALEGGDGLGGRSSPIMVCRNVPASAPPKRKSAIRISVSCPCACSRASGSGGRHR